MSGLELNKIAAAVLFAGLIAMIVGNVTDILYAPSLKSEARGYQISVVESVPGKESPKEEKIDIADLMKSASVEKGKKLFKKCSTCHSYDKNGKNKLGPNLWDIVNSDKAKKTGYSYSKALGEMGGKWSYENLFAFLKSPKKYVKGTKMSFAGIKKDSQIADMVAFLREQSDSPKLLP